MNRHLPAAIGLAFLSVSCGEPPVQNAYRVEPKPASSASAPVSAPAAPELARVVVKSAEYVEPDPNKALAERVKQALEGEAKVHAAAIDVTASGGSVTLWGTADSDDERVRAGRIAYRVQGVNTVNNRLAIVKGS